MQVGCKVYMDSYMTSNDRVHGHLDYFQKPPQNGCWLKSVFWFKALVSHPPHPNSTGLFTKPTGRHYTKDRFSQDIVSKGSLLHKPLRSWSLNLFNLKHLSFVMQQTFRNASKNLLLSYDSQDDGHNYKRVGNVNEVTN